MNVGSEKLRGVVWLEYDWEEGEMSCLISWNYK